MSVLTETLNPNIPEELERAARLLRSGEVVAFPTETVYGLGANGLDADAVQKVFAAKMRPPDNPLILHVHSITQALSLWQGDNQQLELAERLAAVFWPGPLSLVLPARPEIPRAVTAGLDSVAVRVPDHAVALELLECCDVPLAAPSANLSGRPSPTRAEHVAATLDGRIAAILDGGACRVGIESTVLDLRGPTPRLLRPGGIDAAALRDVVGELAQVDEINAAPSPGLRHRHYQPIGLRLSLVESEAIVAAWSGDSAILCLHTTAEKLGQRRAPLAILPAQARSYAAELYGALYSLERSGATELLIERLPDTVDWQAVRDRLSRAAEP